MQIRALQIFLEGYLLMIWHMQALYNLFMNIQPGTPRFVDRFADLDGFICDLVELHQAGTLSSWEELEARVSSFFTVPRMEAMDSVLHHWQKMASYSDGITLTHVMCVFLGMYMLPEFRNLSPEQQDLAKWVILFHDLAKAHIRGQKDNMHAFRSGVLAAKVLPELGFSTSEKYKELIESWSEFTDQAFLPGTDRSPLIPDNQKLPEILAGIDELFGGNMDATLVVKTVLLHISLHVDDMYPTPAPLTADEIKRCIDLNVFPLLQVMMLSDNEGWSLFDAETRSRQRRDTLSAFERVKTLIS